MIRLAVSVEGRTEEEFVKGLFVDDLRTKSVEPQPILLGGGVSVPRLAAEMAKFYRSFDAVTSLVDFYGFVGKEGATPEELQTRIFEEVGKQIDRTSIRMDQSKVLPYVQQYEFEGLLFSDVHAFAELVGGSNERVEALRSIRAQFRSPEHINDNRDTAPSKRIAKLIPRYRKTLDGPLLAMEMGLSVIRSECPRFNNWMTRLESLGGPG